MATGVEQKGTSARAAPAAAPGAARVSPALQAGSQADAAASTIIARDTMTRDRHVFMTRVIGLMALSIVILAVALVFTFSRPQIVRFVATRSDGKVFELSPLDRPLNTTSEVNVWLTNSVVQAYTFSFANYRAELGAARLNFTASGWDGFQKALEASGNLKSVLENQFVTTAVPTAAPVLLSEGLIANRYAWRFQIPVQVTFQSAKSKVTQNYNVNAIVVRESESVSPSGLAIASLIAE